MFSRFFKEDDTLAHMDSNKILRKKRNAPLDPLGEDDDEELRTYEPPRKELKPKRDSRIKKFLIYLQSIDWNPKKHPKVALGLLFCLIALSTLLYVFRDIPNPLIGKWKPMGKNIFLPTGDIEFTKDKVHAMGIATAVKYDIEKNSITVIDATTKRSIVFSIKDAQTIEHELLGVKTVYKKAP